MKWVSVFSVLIIYIQVNIKLIWWSSGSKRDVPFDLTCHTPISHPHADNQESYLILCCFCKVPMSASLETGLILKCLDWAPGSRSESLGIVVITPDIFNLIKKVCMRSRLSYSNDRLVLFTGSMGMQIYSFREQTQGQLLDSEIRPAKTPSLVHNFDRAANGYGCFWKPNQN